MTLICDPLYDITDQRLHATVSNSLVTACYITDQRRQATLSISLAPSNYITDQRRQVTASTRYLLPITSPINVV